jgi:hypothetical protein
MNKTLFSCLPLFCLFATTAPAVERFVPEGGSMNYSNIQSAISASANGDIIRVQPGIYRESITFKNLDIVLTSMNPTDSEIVRSTILEGNGSNSVVTFTGGQTTNALLTGFTIRGGGGTVFRGPQFKFLFGGGVYCYQSSPSIVGNILEENRLIPASTNLYAAGGGISSLIGSPRIARNILRHNEAFAGGAIWADTGTPIIEDNWIYSNDAVIGGGAYLYVHGPFINNTVWDNSGDGLNIEMAPLVMNNIIGGTRGGAGLIAGPYAGEISKWLRYNNIFANENGDVIHFDDIDDRGLGITPPIPIAIAGLWENFSADPRFVNASQGDFHLGANSPCINRGDRLGIRASDEVDFEGTPRIVSLRIDLGATEFHGEKNFPPLAAVGTHRVVSWAPGEAIVLDGSASVDPEGSPLRFLWRQISGPPGAWWPSNSFAFFAPTNLGNHAFELVVNDGVQDSTPETFEILVTNLPPIASAGAGERFITVPERLNLDGSHSLDPERRPLKFRWTLIRGPGGEWTDAQSAKPSFLPRGPGVYLFELVVSDDFQESRPDRVAFYLGDLPPVAVAGGTRYAGKKMVRLDGSQSFSPDHATPLNYKWRQISGPPLVLSKTNTAWPEIRGFQQLTNQTQEASFELVVESDGKLSAPDFVRVVIVPAWKNPSLSLVSGAFDPANPPSWDSAAAIATVETGRDFPPAGVHAPICSRAPTVATLEAPISRRSILATATSF